MKLFYCSTARQVKRYDVSLKLASMYIYGSDLFWNFLCLYAKPGKNGTEEII